MIQIEYRGKDVGKELEMIDIKLMQIERNLLVILKDINKRLNELEQRQRDADTTRRTDRT